MTSGARRASAAFICLLLAIIHTWPLALDPGRWSRNDNGDAQLNEWILAWVAHQLPRDPTHLFEANIFYPAHDALAFSEPLIVPALMGAPLAWLGASPVLVYNLVLIAGFALTAFVTCRLVERWTGDLFAGLLAGSAFAFNTHTLTRLAHVQGIHIYGLPLALLGVDAIITRGGPGPARAALVLVAAMVLMAYTSGYLVVFAAVMVPAALLARAPEWWRRARIVVPTLAAAAAVTAAAVLPVYLPYHRVAREQHMVRTLDTVNDYSATMTGYLASAGRLHVSTWSGRFFRDPVDSFFPGIVVALLSLVAIVAAVRARDQRGRVVMLGGIALVGLLLSLGTATPFYAIAFHAFPPMQGLRVAARFGNLFLLGVALLGGLGLAALRRGLPPEGGSYGSRDEGRGFRPLGSFRLLHRFRLLHSFRLLRSFRLQAEVLPIALILLVNIEALRAPFDYREFTGVPNIYTLLRDEPGPVVLVEQPFFPRRMAFENAPYVLNSTAHWRPLMNGYSGYTPESYQRYADTFWYFPQERAFRAMKEAGVTHVMVHPHRFDRDAGRVIEQVSGRPDMELLAVGKDGIRLYRLHH